MKYYNFFLITKIYIYILIRDKVKTKNAKIRVIK